MKSNVLIHSCGLCFGVTSNKYLSEQGYKYFQSSLHPAMFINGAHINCVLHFGIIFCIMMHDNGLESFACMPKYSSTIF